MAYHSLLFKTDTMLVARIYSLVRGAGLVTLGIILSLFCFVPTTQAASLSTLSASSYLGSSAWDKINDVKVAGDGTIYVVGNTNSPGFPVTTNAYSTVISQENNVPSDVYITRFSSDLSTVLASTFIGGGGVGKAIALDTSGNIFIAGFTGSFEFPVTSGAYDTVYDGYSQGLWGTVGFVSKLNPDLTSLMASTFIGGTNTDEIDDIAIDSVGSVYVVGQTESSDFPVTVGTLKTVHGGYTEGFMAKLNNSLSTLLKSTFVGGTNGKDDLRGIVLAGDGSMYVTGLTTSKYFSAVPGNGYDVSFNSTYPSQSDVFVAKISSDFSSVQAFSYLGGKDEDYPEDIALDSSGHVYVVGKTLSTNFPSTVNPVNSPSGLRGGFVTKFSSSLGAVMNSVLTASLNSVKVTSIGDVYVAGTKFLDPNTSLVSGYDTTINGIADAVVLNYNSTLTNVVSGTYLGGSSYDSGSEIIISPNSSIVVVGNTQSYDFPVSPNAFQKNHSLDEGAEDGFVTKLNGTAGATPVSAFHILPVEGALPFYEQQEPVAVSVPGDLTYGFTSYIRNELNQVSLLPAITTSLSNGHTYFLYSTSNLLPGKYVVEVRNKLNTVVAQSSAFEIKSKEVVYILNTDKNTLYQGQMIEISVYPGIVAYDKLLSGEIKVEWKNSQGITVYPTIISGPNPTDGFSLLTTYTYSMNVMSDKYRVRLYDTVNRKVLSEKEVTVYSRSWAGQRSVRR